MFAFLALIFLPHNDPDNTKKLATEQLSICLINVTTNPIGVSIGCMNTNNHY